MNIFTLLVGAVVIAAAICAVIRKIDVRLTLLLASLVLGGLAGQPAVILQKFLTTLTDEKYVVPISCAMGFAYVLRHTQCDQHLVQLLVRPLLPFRSLLIPGTVAVGFLVNIPIISQTSTAIAVGTVLIPVLFAARFSPVTTGSALLLGAYLGGELLNPAAPEYAAIVKELNKWSSASVTGATLVQRTLPMVALELCVTLAVFWLLSRYAESRSAETESAVTVPEETAAFRVNRFKAAIPLLPLFVLFLTSQTFSLVHVPQSWLLAPSEMTDVRRASEMFNSRLIGAAMLIGVAAAALTALGSQQERKAALVTAKAFFDGAGFAFAEIISIIAAANCFAESIRLIGVGALIGQAITAIPALLVPMGGLLPLGFAVVSGSGMASTQGLYGFFAEQAVRHGFDPVTLGSLIALAAAAGRTMSPVAAVVLMCAELTRTNPVELAKRVALPLLTGIGVVLVWAIVTAKVR